ncbi:hypothetical protein [Prosthecochloris sp. HL-130-GSB]|jgi:hypothetical protein|uniref:Uncharacterized protein n=1 Tax=Prosthecochloris aestuarii TaxID=1102 RepID=A0A831WW19_PROAE|nr:hypothetical protein [Prosthecochloris sp. HL-130-GSB]ARM30075.1 hypothetical protein B9H02_00340 [Prosthecochloris sp. HL-130-GSB]MBO8092309.1 hypothetical protein [Prosthecochloris sp.]HED31779.1 hypothetical protein [Prosthecochloris aestuarii]
MKKVLFPFALLLILLLHQTQCLASLNQFTGTWKNIDADTRGVTRLEINRDGNEFRLHAWGKCHPEDCDWGEVPAYAYGASVSSNIEQTARAVTAVFTEGFKVTFIELKPMAQNRLRADVFTRFTDNSNRTNYTASYTFQRELQVMPVKPLPLPLSPQVLQEDCIPFNPATTTVKNVNGSWKIVDGNHWMFDFGNKKDEALKALRVIKHYNLNQSCFVGRPDPSFSYMLKSGNAPQGPVSGEDCVRFNPNTIEVKNIANRWKIVDGSHWVFDFGDKEDEARKAYAIIRKYGFTHSCYVGRPDPSFQYLRK